MFQKLYNTLVSLISLGEDLTKSLDTTDKDLLELFERSSIDKSILDQIPYYENPFVNRYWEITRIALPNTSMRALLELAQLRVRILELLIEKERCSFEELEDARRNLEEIHKRAFLYD